MASIWSELKRRNVVKVAVAYAIVAWLLVEIAATILPIFGAPRWALQTITFVIILGFPLALIFAWAFELTPEGFKREKDVDRSESTTHVSSGRKLDFVIIAVLAIAVVVFAVDRFVLDSGTGPTVAEQEASVAVLPFVDMSPDQDQEYFSDGISEELLNQLTKLHGLHVAGRTSSFSFKGKDEDLRIIGEKLNVANILEGSVRKAGDRIRITVQLIKASDGYHLWSQTYDRDLDDIFAIQEETAKAVADALSITLGVGDTTFNAGGTRNFEAYDAVLAARSLMFQQGTENFTRAIELLEKAVQIDPDYGDAWSLLANAYTASGRVWIADRAEEMFAKARLAAARASEIAPEAVSTLRAVASDHIVDNDWAGAERAYRKALALAPADVLLNLTYGIFLLDVGRPDEAVRYLTRAVEIDPLSLGPTQLLGLAYQIAGDYTSALNTYERGKSLIGNHVILDGSMIVLAMEMDDREFLEEYLDRMVNNPAVLTAGRSFTQKMLAGLDSPEVARGELRQQYQDPDLGFADPLSKNIIATYASYFGDYELTLSIFRELSEQNVLAMDQIWRRNFHGARRLPGFKDVIRNMRLDEYWRSTGKWGDFCRPLGHADFECE